MTLKPGYYSVKFSGVDSKGNPVIDLSSAVELDPETGKPMTTTQKCPCCLQPAEELRLLPEDSMLPDEPICRDCFYEYRAQNDETEYNDLKKAEV